MSILRASLAVSLAIWICTSSIAKELNIQGKKITVESVPPVVVKTIPQAGSTDVDPNLTEIKVTFSKEMADGSWSWSTVSKDTFPKITGKPKYEKDKRTCVLAVKLEPEKTYGVWVNSAKFKNFKDSKKRPAVPYLLVFRTTASK